MASPLADAHIEAERRLRVATVAVVERLWNGLGSWNESDAERWVSQVVPVVLTAQRTSVSLTDAYLARAMGRRPLGVGGAELIGAGVRNGASPETVYHRPFVTLWSALAGGRPFEDALASGLARASSTAAMDVQLSMRGAANAVNAADPEMYGFERVADGAACAFCQEVDGAFVKSGDAMALHNNCGCSLEPLTAPRSGPAGLPPGVAVHEHGELGAVLTDPAHDFTTAAEALS